MVNGVQDNIRVRRGIRVIAGPCWRLYSQGQSGGLKSGWDHVRLGPGTKRKQGVEKQIPDMQPITHRVYDLFRPAGDAALSPASCPIIQTSSALTSRRYGLP